MKEIIGNDALLLSQKLERVDRALADKAAAGEKLTKEDRDAVVGLVEQGMARRGKEFGGTDPLARDLNRMLEPHQRVAMSAARNLAQHDRDDHENPFQHDQLQRAYNSEKTFLKSIERPDRDAKEADAPGRSAPVLEGEENVMEEVKERVVDIDPKDVADRTAENRARDRQERERVEAERAEVDRLAGRAEGKRINIENLQEAAEERDNANRTAMHAGQPVEVKPQRDAEREKNRQAELLDGIHRQYRAAGNAFMFKDRPEKVAFRDRGTKLTTGVNDERVAFAMATMAEAKGWKTINVSGHVDFKREVWMEASLRGIKVKGFEPKEQDLKELRERQERGERNAIEPVPERTRQKAGPDRTPPAAEKSDKTKVVEAVAAAVVDAKVKDPAQRAEIKAAIDTRLAERAKAGKVPSVPVYDKDAPAKTKQVDRDRPQVERNAERTR